MFPDALIDLAAALNRLASDDATLSALPELPTEKQLGLPRIALATEELLNRAHGAAKRMHDDEAALSDSLGAAATAYSEAEWKNAQGFNGPTHRPPWELYRPPTPAPPGPTPAPQQSPAAQPGDGHTPQPHPGPQPTPGPGAPAGQPSPAPHAAPPTGHDQPPPSPPSTGGPVPPTAPGPDVLRRPGIPNIVIPPGPPPGDRGNGLGGGR